MEPTRTQRRKRRRLHGIEVEKVSFVDRAANLRDFLLLKRLKGTEPMDDDITIEPEEMEVFDPEILKALDPKVAKRVAAAVKGLRAVYDQLPKALQSAVDRLGHAVEGKETEGYPPVKKSLGDDETVLAGILEDIGVIKKHLGIAPDQVVSLRDLDEAIDVVLAERFSEGGGD